MKKVPKSVLNLEKLSPAGSRKMTPFHPTAKYKDFSPRLGKTRQEKVQGRSEHRLMKLCERIQKWGSFSDPTPRRVVFRKKVLSFSRSFFLPLWIFFVCPEMAGQFQKSRFMVHRSQVLFGNTQNSSEDMTKKYFNSLKVIRAVEA